jgi:F-type H+-transporting ATPase subunit a
VDFFNHYVNAQSEQTWVCLGVAIGLSIFFVIVGNYLKKVDPLKKPSVLIIIVDAFYGFIRNLHQAIFKGVSPLMFAYAGCLFIFLLVMNMIGLFLPVSAPATDYNIPLSLVLISFGFRYALEFKYMGIKSHLKEYVSPVPFMLPLNIMDIIAKPLSMSMRLFGNLLSGSLILTVFYAAIGYIQNLIIKLPENGGEPIINVLGALVAPPLHFYFDIFAGGIQAFVFTLLTLIFSSLALDFDEILSKKEGKKV